MKPLQSFPDWTEWGLVALGAMLAAASIMVMFSFKF